MRVTCERGSDFTFTKPLACDAMMVMSPGFGFGLSFGIYCFTASWSTSSCECAVARGYSRICWASTTCSLMSNMVDMVLPLGELVVVARAISSHSASSWPLSDLYSLYEDFKQVLASI